ncbi:MAG: CHAT domain-containing protein [Candidatus Lokiarchaeota archaeon]|nr:CHAT domain-containing protein [Candidatus Lokiarchaeota archaeon]
MYNPQTKVLVVFANPRDTSQLRVGEEDRAIRQSIKLSHCRDSISLTMCHATTIHDLRRALLNEDYQIVHISGHGIGAGLILENELGEKQIVPQQALAGLLRAYSPPIKCVVLNACYSVSQGQLTSLGVPFTIAMDGAISDKAAIEFSRGFYDAVGAGRDIDFAYKEGCRTVRLAAPGTQFVSQILKDSSQPESSYNRLAPTHRQSDIFAVRPLLASLPIPPVFCHARPPETFWANRKRELDLLTQLWRDENTRVVGLIGWGGVGKSTLARRWFDEFSDRRIEPDGFFWWSFYYQPSLDQFLEAILSYLTNGKFRTSKISSPWARIQQFAALLAAGKFIIVLDGLEVMQKTENANDDFGRLEDRAFRNLLELCADPKLHQSFVLITSRVPLADIRPLDGISYRSLQVDYFSDSDGAEYLRQRGIKGDTKNLCQLSREYGGHALSLSLLAGYLNEYFDGQSQNASEIPPLATSEETKVNQILKAYDARLTDVQRAAILMLSAFRRPVAHKTFESVAFQQKLLETNPLLESLSTVNPFGLRSILRNLEQRGLIIRESHPQDGLQYTLHPIIREYFYDQISINPSLKRQVNLQLREFFSQFPIPDQPVRLRDLTPFFDSVIYTCRAELFDEAALQICENWVRVDRWEIGYWFGAYEFEISFLREFFPERDLTRQPLVTDPKARSFLITEIGYALYKLGRLSEALAFWEQAVEEHSGSLDHKTLAIVCYGLAQAKATMGRLNEAYIAARDGLRFSRLSEAKLWECNCLATLGWLAFLRGEFALAEQSYQEANSLEWSEDPEELGLFSVLGVEYGTFLLTTGRIEQSLEHTERNIAICEERDWQDSLVHCERLLGDIALVRQQTALASQHYTRALELARSFGVQEQIALVLLGIAKISISFGELEEALANLASALNIAQQFHYVIPQVSICNCQARAYLMLHQNKDARDRAQTALELAKATGYAWGKATALQILGELAALAGNCAEAKVLLANAETIQKQIHDPSIETTQRLIRELDE